MSAGMVFYISTIIFLISLLGTSYMFRCYLIFYSATDDDSCCGNKFFKFFPPDGSPGSGHQDFT